MNTLTNWPEALLGRKVPADRLFIANAVWRDYLAVYWDLQTFEGLADISSKLNVPTVQPNNVEAISDTEVTFESSTANGSVKALAELNQGICTRLFTSLEELDTKPNTKSTAPYVLIIGAGQSGLALGARLGELGVPYLIVEQNRRVGDNWRKRYDSLILHDPVWVNHMPRKPFPTDWPTFTPKDMMGDWLEGYAKDLKLNVRCDCTLEAARFNEQQQAWDIQLNGTWLAVPHLVFAVGTSGFAKTPDFPGQSDFIGQQMHSSAYVNGDGLEGKNVVIVGATNSAHDIAVDLVKHNAKPLMIQRSSTHVVPHKVYVERILGALYGPDKQLDLQQADFLSLSTPMRRLEVKARALFDAVKQDWSQFYASLENTGFALDFAEDGTGIVGKYRRSASGYYIDVGGSAKVSNGDIAVHSGAGIKHIGEDHLVLSDGTELPADVIIYATGFGTMEEWVARLIDEETAAKIGTCWGYGSGYRGDPGPWQGELRNMWKPTAQSGLWFMGGNLAQVRMYSHYLALQLAAKQQGLSSP